MNFNWNQAGMPAILVSRLGRQNEQPSDAKEPEKPRPREPPSILEGIDEWEEWDRKFRALLD